MSRDRRASTSLWRRVARVASSAWPVTAGGSTCAAAPSAATSAAATRRRPSTRPATSRRTGHPIITSFEPGESWFYSFVTEDFVDGPALAPPEEHPHDQPTPGPRGSVPPDWRRHLHD